MNCIIIINFLVIIIDGDIYLKKRFYGFTINNKLV